MELTGQLDGENRKLSSNTEASGRFHTDWLNMMYPRLKVARNLLRDDGVIFVSIDDHEASSLRRLFDEIFGEENFIAQFVWNTEGHTDNQFDVKANHEYVLLFAKNSHAVRLGHVVDPNTREESNLWKGFAENSITKNGPENPLSEVLLPIGFPSTSEGFELQRTDVAEEFFTEIDRQGYISRAQTKRYAVTYPIRLDAMSVRTGTLASPCRVVSGWANLNKLQAFIQNGFQPIDDNGDKLSFYLSGKGVIYYRRDRETARNILSVFRGMGTTEKMRSELEQLGIPFQYPKPKELIKYIVQIGAESGGIVLDFFAGSGSTAHAAMLQNVADGEQRPYILIQLPEPLEPETGNQRGGVQLCDQLGKPRNLAEVLKERLRRTKTQIEQQRSSATSDLGFRVFKLDTSNIRAWEPDRNDLDGALLENIDHIKPGRSEEDILYEVLLKLGLDLCVPIETRNIAGKSVRSIGAGTLIACLNEMITREEVEPLARGIADWRAELEPAGDTTVIFRDSAFEDDVAKTNLAAIMEQRGLENVRSL